jgi:hypothetical protein
VKLYEGEDVAVERTTELDWSSTSTPKVGQELSAGGTVRFQTLQEAENSPVKHFGEKEWRQIAVELRNSLLSQFMHGERGRCSAARIVNCPVDRRSTTPRHR